MDSQVDVHLNNKMEMKSDENIEDDEDYPRVYENDYVVLHFYYTRHIT